MSKSILLLGSSSFQLAVAQGAAMHGSYVVEQARSIDARANFAVPFMLDQY